MPTDGRCRKRSPNYVPDANEYQMPKTVKELQSEVKRLLGENEALKEQVSSLKATINKLRK